MTKQTGKGASARKHSSTSHKRRTRQGMPGFLLPMIAVGLLLILGAYFLNYGGAGDAAGARRAEETGIRFSGAMPANVSATYTAAGTAADWFEITNDSGAAVNLKGMMVAKSSSYKKILVFPNWTLEAGRSAIVFCDGKSSTATELHAPFALSAAGETLVLMDKTYAVVDELAVPGLENNEAYVRENGEWAITSAGVGQGLETLSRSAQGGVVISEIMASNATYAAPDGGMYDYIELHNASAAAASLSGWTLSDSAENPARWAFPDMTLPADGYVLVYLSGKISQDPAFLQADFKLSAKGESAVLANAAGQIADRVDFGALLDDQAYSLTDGGFTADIAPTPGQPNTAQGVAATAAVLRNANAYGVYITEIMTSTAKWKYDWVEIMNASSAAVDLSSFGLSDKSGAPRRWQFPAGTVIQPGQYLGIYCSGLSDTNLGGMLNASFALSVDGGYTMSLSDPEGKVFDRVYVPPQYAEISYGRDAGLDNFCYFDVPTAGAANGSGYSGRAAVAAVSVPGGLYAQDASLEIALSAPQGARIHYTLDCSDPDESDPLYSGPIAVASTTILRTRVYQDGCIPSYIDTQSYMFGANHTVYVASLVSENDRLFGANGIYTNTELTTEVEGHIEVFTADGSETAIAQGCGIKLHGDFSRSEKQKAFKIYARSAYGGGSTFQYPLFSNRDYQEYSSFLLRSSGQDTTRTRMRDSVLQSLAKGTSLYYQETETCVLYINGQYWGQYYFREHVNAYSICQFENWEGQKDDIDLIKANNTVFQGSNDTFAELLNWVKSNNTNSDAAYQRIGSVIDIQNYIEYMSIEIFTGNTDTLNVKRYRNKNDDGLWRWVLYDLDWAFNTDTDSLNRWLTPGGMGNGGRTDNTLFVACMKNDRFRDEFLTYFGQKLATDYSTENVMNLFYAQYQLLLPELPAQFERWGQTDSGYQAALKKLIEYAQERPGLILQRAQKTLGFSNEQMEHYFGDARRKIEEG